MSAASDVGCPSGAAGAPRSTAFRSHRGRLLAALLWSCTVLVPAVVATAGAADPATRYRWRAVETADLKQHFRKLIRVTDRRGAVAIGMLVDVVGDSLRLRRARGDGGGLVQIPLGGVTHVEIFETGSP